MKYLDGSNRFERQLQRTTVRVWLAIVTDYLSAPHRIFAFPVQESEAPKGEPEWLAMVHERMAQEGLKAVPDDLVYFIGPLTHKLSDAAHVTSVLQIMAPHEVGAMITRTLERKAEVQQAISADHAEVSATISARSAPTAGHTRILDAHVPLEDMTDEEIIRLAQRAGVSIEDEEEDDNADV